MTPLYKRTLYLKIFAIVTMVIDHVGFIFFPHVWWLRLIGRLSFPVFGFLLVTGFDTTKNKLRYGLRLGTFAIISQYFYNLAFQPSHFTLNIFVTLLIAFLVLLVITTQKLPTWAKYLLVIYLGLMSFILPIDYGILGVASIVSIYFLRRKKYLVIISQIIIWGIYSGIDILLAKHSGSPIHLKSQLVQVFAPAAFIIIYGISSIKLKTESWQISQTTKRAIQYGFYLFYPVHLLVLYLIKYAIK